MIRERWLFGRSCPSFTLQWHLTNACAYACAHCYDRSVRTAPSLSEALRIVCDLQSFCVRHRVKPQVCLSGGDPLAYPHFWELYAELARARIPVSLLGNPVGASVISRLLQIAHPRSYQVSLEGLEDYNDKIRGAGHHAACLRFLDEARRLGLRTHVMLTLGKGNLDQVIPLAEELRGRTHRLTFNRLCQVGCGATLEIPTREEYIAFLERYRQHSRFNPLLGFKDNLLNILLDRDGLSPGGGCTGHGCGAAFNFVALLPDGEVHACRKFPSLLGNVGTQSFADLYDSAPARAYRRGPAACLGCHLRDHCKGCMAVSHGQGRDPLRERDPHCFVGKP